MKKALIFVLVIFMVFGITGCKKNITNDELARYEKIKNEFAIAMDKHIESSFVIKDSRNCNGFINGNTMSDTLIKSGILNKESMLDVDNKSYCKAIAKKYVVPVNDSNDLCEMKYDIYLKCKKYQTEGFDDLEYRSFLNFDYGVAVYS